MAYLLVTSTSALAELLQLGGASAVRAGQPGSGERRSEPGRPGSASGGQGRGGRDLAVQAAVGAWQGGRAPASRVRGRGGRNPAAQAAVGAAGLWRAAVGAGAAGIRRRKPRSRQGGVESGRAGRSSAQRGGAESGEVGRGEPCSGSSCVREDAMRERDTGSGERCLRGLTG
ncbi:hypothetical protein BDA96_02G103200 [Sorghum bicolor]|uniref:Uncharacterized protein n=1 Tax=Sorghum bicolor TaxID=4558 RepID=A0A921USC3_SORBI|nr:spidroin-1-like [Sorghum bicolor]KAG0542428.1 hypothetical protein BDA96_02G103200 [Sorghum bicolor]|eukprot:XP_021309052.1 spidroin-1-like [Sorghum bicolor]